MFHVHITVACSPWPGRPVHTDHPSVRQRQQESIFTPNLAFSSSQGVPVIPYLAVCKEVPEGGQHKAPHHNLPCTPDHLYLTPKRTTPLTLIITIMQGWTPTGSSQPGPWGSNGVQLSWVSLHGIILFYCLQGPETALGRTLAWWREEEASVGKRKPPGTISALGGKAKEPKTFEGEHWTGMEEKSQRPFCQVKTLPFSSGRLTVA